MRNSASVFSAELTAIYACLSHILHLPSQNKYLILTDSLSSLKSISDPYSSNPITQRILLVLHTLTATKISIVFMWIPGHIDFPDHDLIDRAAKQATSLPKITDPAPSTASDLKNYYRSLISLCATFGKIDLPTNLHP